MIFLFPCVLPAQPSSTGDGPGVTILIYHRFGESKYPSTNVSEERFREQMAYLMMNNYQVISLADMVEAIREQTPLPDKAVVITIDDGYRSTYEVAWPILQSFGFPFTVFLYVEGVERNFPGYLNWEEIRELQAAGVDFQDHSYFHHHLADWPAGLDEPGYRQWIRDDFKKSAAILAERLGRPPHYAAIPYGEYNTIVQEEVRGLGYQAVFSQDPGSVSLETDINSIPREPILGNDWSTMAHFEEILERVDLPVTVMEPPPRVLKDDLVEKFGAGLLYPERYRKGTLGIYVSGLGWQRARIDGDFVSIDNDLPLQRHLSRVTVSGREKDSGRLALRTWLLVRPQ